ncbi:Maf-like protein [Flavobacterium cheniae]|jgi:septum formation protein|uniref:dTTP/UTP pyrophosphatase n=1 Tax=Flavobacterium cheniae TaxID=295428 RepID=A0A562KSN2_9FLAO|nr:Maf-like protein [Flavobacterium cheniae]TDR25478.1 septum formation protein [Flavobacterium cheniae]TWH98336.1 septum formation protein [Flavobacterium cheniae]
MLKEKLNKINIILASGSPRRQQFFKEMDLHYTIRLKEIEEIYPEHLQAEEITNFLAELKASAFENELEENDVLVTSDTIVWLNGKALGKPKDYDDAFKMLQQLANQTHEVITSVCLKSIDKTDVFHCVTKVTFANLSDEAITYYLNNYQPFDKAGSYGIQDWIGLIGISKIEGSYTNVVGLPTEMLFQKLMNYV